MADKELPLLVPGIYILLFGIRFNATAMPCLMRPLNHAAKLSAGLTALRQPIPDSILGSVWDYDILLFGHGGQVILLRRINLMSF